MTSCRRLLLHDSVPGRRATREQRPVLWRRTVSSIASKTFFLSSRLPSLRSQPSIPLKQPSNGTKFSSCGGSRWWYTPGDMFWRWRRFSSACSIPPSFIAYDDFTNSPLNSRHSGSLFFLPSQLWLTVLEWGDRLHSQRPASSTKTYFFNLDFCKSVIAHLFNACMHFKFHISLTILE